MKSQILSLSQCLALGNLPRLVSANTSRFSSYHHIMSIHQTKMRAVCIQQVAETAGSTPYSAENPAPSSALRLEDDVPIPELKFPGDLLIRIHAATVTRDELTWPESYRSERLILGHDFSGEVISVFDSHVPGNEPAFSPGDYVYGMTAAEGKGSTWAEFAVIKANEAALKPNTLDWAGSATVPMSALTAWQALHIHAGVAEPDLSTITSRETISALPKIIPLLKLLVTGASGAIGTYLVQLGVLARLHITAASSSSVRNAGFLRSLGADEVVEYKELVGKRNEYDIIIDTTGGQILESCWSLIKEEGCLITVDSSSLDFVEKHREILLAEGKEKVKTFAFIVKPSQIQLRKIAAAVELQLLKEFVGSVFPFDKACEAYETASRREARHGKVALLMQMSNA